MENIKELVLQLKGQLEDAEEEMNVEVEHTKKFLWRGSGLRHDFSTADSARRRRLLRGVWDNERALCAAMREAEAAGLPREYMEDAIRVQQREDEKAGPS